MIEDTYNIILYSRLPSGMYVCRGELFSSYERLTSRMVLDYGVCRFEKHFLDVNGIAFWENKAKEFNRWKGGQS